ncbi:MAG: Eco57I restriction-modification methylase domain-containing protein [Promethearchaeota archaeon]
MTSKSSLLRNIRLSGGLFTENILLRLRDNPEQLDIGKIKSFIEKDNKEVRKQFKDARREIFEWCIEKWDEISQKVEGKPKIDQWGVDQLTEKWLIPFFSQFQHKLESFKKENVDEDNPLVEFSISFQSKGHENPFFHIVGVKEDFESKIDSNPKKSSHHNICQQFINLNPEVKWLILTNGKILRLLTEYYHTYSKGYLEFDLENIFANRDEKEFNTLFSVVHHSRFEPKPDDHIFLIEEFQQEAVTEGIKIGDALRDNVHDALELLGNQLIQQNPKFLDYVIAGNLDKEEYYAELLRIIYRIIFILYAEQREMLPGAGSIYFEEFSLSSLRMLAERPIKAEKNIDLWEKLFLTFNLVGKGNEFLEINAFDGSLFDDKNLEIIVKKNLKLNNDTLLGIVRLLTTTISNNSVRQRINYLEIREEEIGAIYESLLDYKPYIDDKNRFELIEGTERKSTGSYYTPKELIDILIRTTLQPLVEERLKEAENDPKAQEKALIDIKVCDPACGGGTFLLSALDFLGKKLAEITTSSENPSEKDLRVARRVVLQHCIYGVDVNPLAVELAKISLWLRASVRNNPLSFLDNHIKNGNSLVGLGQKIEITEINPNSFEAIGGNRTTGIKNENRALRSKARELIKKEIKEMKKKGKKTLITSFFTEKRTGDICSTKFEEIINMAETNPNKIEEKKKEYKKIRQNENFQQALKEANIWTSAYFWTFEGEVLGEIPRYTTIEQLRNKINDPELNDLLRRITDLAKENSFFHWYIEFPEVFSTERGGFDCILTNPPWDVLEFEDIKFFTGLDSNIVSAPNQSKRRILIKELIDTNPPLFDSYSKSWRSMKKTLNFLKKSNLFSLSTRGKLNTYALFAERAWTLLSPDGYLGIICPTSIIMNYFMQDLFRAFVKRKSILSLFDFENKEKLFNITTQERFCLLTLGGQNITKDIIPMTFKATNPIQVLKPLEMILNYKAENNIIPKESKLLILKPEDFSLLNPNTLTCPSFSLKKEADLIRRIYKLTEILIKRDENNDIISNPWNIQFNTLFNMSSDSELFYTKEQLREEINAKAANQKNLGGIWMKGTKIFYPLYDGKMIWQYDHRYQSEFIDNTKKHRKLKTIKTSANQHKMIHFSTTPAYWVEDEKLDDKIPRYYNRNWFIAFRDITGVNNERTFVATIIPKSGAGHTLPMIFSDIEPKLLACLLANINSIIIDFVTRRKTSGTHMSFYIVEQLPIFPPKKYSKNLIEFISHRVLNLTFNSLDLKEFALDLNYEKNPIQWDAKKRIISKSELDALFSHLYKVTRKELSDILEDFEVLKKYELEEYNEFITKKLVLDAYDKLSNKKELFE